MIDLVWHEPMIEDIEKMSEILQSSDFIGSDMSYVNIFLLKEKYNIKICFYKGFLLRKYDGSSPNRIGYGFPIGSGDIKEIFSVLKHDAESNRAIYKFCLLSEKQTRMIKDLTQIKFSINIDEGDGDYIYLQSDLSELRGRKFQKKRNHISKFIRQYKDFRFESIDNDNKKDVLLIADKWYNSSVNADKNEIKSIYIAVNYFSRLKLTGSIMYVSNIPVAFTIVSKINNVACDVHYEKAVGEFAINGAYSVINKFTAENMSRYKFINREEDIGLISLKKAKLSYHPYMILYKYFLQEE